VFRLLPTNLKGVMPWAGLKTFGPTCWLNALQGAFAFGQRPLFCFLIVDFVG